MSQHVSDRLFGILSHPDFLSMKGLANEVPIFIQTYEPQDEDKTRRLVEDLAARLSSSGILVAVVDLFDLILDQLEEEGRLEPILEREPSLEKRKMFDLMSNLADPKTRLIPRLMTAIGEEGTQLALLTGVGRVYPFLRTHTILESLQPAMVSLPVVMFFPGRYEQDENGASVLRLFGSLPSPPIHRPYYRAFNLDHYRL
jgi:BREX protein BrxB